MYADANSNIQYKLASRTTCTDGRIEYDPRGMVGVSGAVRETLTASGTRGLLLVGATEFCFYTRTENITDFEQHVMNKCTVRVLAGWVVSTRHS